ncbi:hypothetical protein QP916_02775 [Corynebacterium accolens]|uniref:hypothetical protein n=1 Tax=Corynebacterium accolens TaxID=38284 RepID=UPI00254C4186|nr:hypothetical protein [Corynebacterium accolens]MDK8497590.1 hypothetical protein [Corynebacterium accolens]
MKPHQARNILRRWAAGKHITKAQLADLTDQGYVTTVEDGQQRITQTGTLLLNGKDSH